MKESSTFKVFMIYYERFTNFLCVFFVAATQSILTSLFTSGSI